MTNAGASQEAVTSPANLLSILLLSLLMTVITDMIENHLQEIITMIMVQFHVDRHALSLSYVCAKNKL